ncbi:glycoside hydrolase superfamily [Aspergillus ambiguus]|uniref:putative cell wall glucanase (Scw11) n=1 Tax=Aspergillus ambiguus TaxID=176160 RepID=UPI003CCD9AC2
MKAAVLAAALAGTALADVAHMRRGHDSFHHRRALHAQEEDETCGCTTEVITYYGPPTTIPISTPTPTPETTSTEEVTTTLHSTRTDTVTVTASPTPEVTLPTPGVSSFSSTGVYTIPATTVTVFDTTTVCGATSTNVPSGTATYGGVTTVVETSTTVTCPYATVKPTGSTVTSVIETTTYVCPAAGTYTVVPPTTTVVPSSTVLVYPTPATFTPGTYTQDEQTVTVTRTEDHYVCPTFHGNEPTSTPAPTTTAVPTTTAAPSSTTVPASSTSAATSTPIPTGDGQMGMTYSPYTNAGGCKSKADVLQDIRTIKSKGFTHVRVYSTDCSSLEWIGQGARENGLIMILGVFIDSTGISGAQSQVTDIANWAQWDLVSLIVVGNEAIQNGYCTASELAGFLTSAKQTWKAAGYTGQVTTTEPINVWQSSGDALCSSIDILGANIHPFFNSEVIATEAGKFVQGQVDILKKICPGKDVVNLETGWPSNGSPNGLAIPGTLEQASAIHSLVNDVGALSVFFSFADDKWKDPGAFGVEQWWGCIDQFN